MSWSAMMPYGTSDERVAGPAGSLRLAENIAESKVLRSHRMKKSLNTLLLVLAVAASALAQAPAQQPAPQAPAQQQAAPGQQPAPGQPAAPAQQKKEIKDPAE